MLRPLANKLLSQMKTGMQKMHNSLELIEAKKRQTSRGIDIALAWQANKVQPVVFFQTVLWQFSCSLMCRTALMRCSVIFFAFNIEFEILAVALSEVRFPACCMEAVGVSEGESRHVACQPHSVVNYGTPRVFKEGRGCAVKTY